MEVHMKTLFFTCLLFVCHSALATNKANVLFIAIDDLRVQYGPYDLDDAKTPNIDRLAKQGVAFTRAYSNVPVCGASRASMLTGVRPTIKRFVAFNSAQDDAPWAKPMPQVFKENGYTTLSLGKIFNNFDDHEAAWSELPWRPEGAKNEDSLTGNKKQNILLSRHNYLVDANLKIAKKNVDNHPAFEISNVNDDAYKNGKIAVKAIHDLTRLKQQGKPFFLAVGFKKPHLPFNAPKKYWDMYSAADIKLTNTPNMPLNFPKQAHHSWGELRNYGHDGAMPKKGTNELMPDDMARKLIHGYRAATSYTDALVGRVLDKLSELNLDENTIVVLWGDHGWSLGEHTQWAKHSSFNVVNQIPLIIKAPGFSQDQFADGLVESVDIFPTLTELTHLPLPKSAQGSSLVPMLKDTKHEVKQAVFPRWKNADSIRTDRYFYTEWRHNKTHKIIGRMLFDHLNDKHETKNLAENPAYQRVVEDLHNKLKAHILSVED
jgi:arylsulfatase A-like enzyme